MGWLWGSNSKADSKVTDKLEPGLREFLEKEAPSKYRPSEPSSSSTHSAQSDSYRSQVGLDSPAQPSNQKSALNANQQAAVPRESLYQDGRYAHLWRNYRPVAEIEDSSKTDQERIMDVLEGFKERRAQIGRAALENCAFEQLAVSECFKAGGWSARATMCKAENRQLNRCYTTQAKLLKALGYLRMEERTREEEEAMQMHADTLYHRMLYQEKLIKEAKEKGLPAPELQPVLPGLAEGENGGGDDRAESTTPTSSVPLNKNLPTPNLPGRKRLNMEELSEDGRKKVLKRLEGLPPQQRALEEHVIAGEMQQGDEALRNLTQVYEQEKKNRIARKEAGKETFGDWIKNNLGR